MKGNKLFLVIAVLAVVAGFAVGGYFMSQDKKAKEEGTPRVAAAELIESYNPTFGPADAKVTIVEFMDPECEACREMYLVVKQLLIEYEGKLRVVVRYMPFHGNALYAASVLEEARDHGKYDEASYALFEAQPEWGSHDQPQPELIPSYMQKIGLDPKLMEREAVIAKHRWKVEKDYVAGMKLGVEKTPTFFVNGRMLNTIGYDVLRQAIEAELAAQ